MNDKYEYTILASREGYIDKKLQEYEDDGWIAAGDATVKYFDPPTSAAFIYIPMKRSLNETELASARNFKEMTAKLNSNFDKINELENEVEYWKDQFLISQSELNELKMGYPKK